MGTEIHPTATVADGAELGRDCCIGPYCAVGANVRLGGGTKLHSHVVVDGHTRFGRNCQVFSFACIGKASQDLKYRGGITYVEIGAGTTLREYVTVNAATETDGKTVIGSNCHILAYSHVAHDCQLGNHIIISNATHLAGHVVLHDHVVLGGMVGIHQFVRVGAMAMVSATAKVVQDVPPFCLADGHPAITRTVNRIGMQRNAISRAAIDAVTRAYKTIFRAGITLEAATTQLREEYADQPEVQLMIRFVEASERGLARPKTGTQSPQR